MPRRSGSMLCPRCRKLISVSEPRCPYCGALQPGLWGLAPALQRLFGSHLDLTLPIIVACVLLYTAGLLLGMRGMPSSNPLTMLSPSGSALYRLGMTGGWALREGRWWTLVTAIYLHGSALHILFNMLALRQIGSSAEGVFGAPRFFVLFTLTGVAGFLLSGFARPGGASVGASGAIFGCIGALIAYYRRRGGALGEAMWRQLLQWVLVMFVLGIAMPGIDNLAHLGGLASGFLLGQWLPAQDERRTGSGMQLAAVLLCAATLVAFALNWVLSPSPISG